MPTHAVDVTQRIIVMHYEIFRLRMVNGHCPLLCRSCVVTVVQVYNWILISSCVFLNGFMLWYHHAILLILFVLPVILSSCNFCTYIFYPSENVLRVFILAFPPMLVLFPYSIFAFSIPGTSNCNTCIFRPPRLAMCIRLTYKGLKNSNPAASLLLWINNLNQGG